MGGENKVEQGQGSRAAGGSRWKVGRSHDVATRRRRLAPALLAAMLLAAGCGWPAGEAQAERVIQIAGSKRTVTVPVYIGKSEDVRTDTSFVEITVGDPDIADVNPLTDRSLSILGKKNGTTRVAAYAEGKKLIGVFDVEVVYDTSLLQSEIKRRFPYANLRVSAVNGRIMLSGTSPDAPTLDRAVTMAKQFGPDVINTVQVLSPQQVMLEVRFVEATRQAGRELGVQWNSFSNGAIANIGSRTAANELPVTPTGQSPFKQPGVTAGGPNVGSNALSLSPIVAAGVLSGTAPFGFLVARMVASGFEVQSLINALEQKGVARSLAEPNLVALSGDTASFLAGGEFPVPVPGALGQVTIEFKRYGVGLAFTPTVLGDGLINMKIEPEVSQLDTSHPVQVAGISIPPLIVRRASTTVELRDGQSFVIGGLLQSEGKNSLQQLPWVGDIPVLGALFRSTSYQKNETDLVIIVTPRLVRPARPGDVIKTPLDASLPPNDADLFLLGKTEVTPAMAKVMAGMPPREFTGHVLDLPKGGANVVSVRN
jgi:pilus assembly protein CpaC